MSDTDKECPLGSKHSITVFASKLLTKVTGETAMVTAAVTDNKSRYYSHMNTAGSLNPVLICLYEDRPLQIAGLKVLLLSLQRHCPSWPIRLRFPDIPPLFRTWLGRFPQISVCKQRLTAWGSYDVKPSVLLDGLATGAGACLWLDTDVLVNGDLAFLSAVPPETVIVTQDPWEYKDGSTHRCASWGLTEGRSMPGPVNSSVVRVSQAHKGLLEQWRKSLLREAYLAEQAKSIERRNQHLLSDQDALSALLACDSFATVPVVRLGHSVDILQHHGAGAYRLKHRWSNLRQGMPPLLHAMGTLKPWRMPDNPSPFRTMRAYYERAYLELSPYVHYARQYRSELDEKDEWLDVQTFAARVGTALAFNRPQLKGTLQATLHSVLSPR